MDELVSEGLLDEADLPPKVPVDDVDFIAVAKVKQPLLVKAADRLLDEPKFKYLKEQMAQFRCVLLRTHTAISPYQSTVVQVSFSVGV